MAVPSRDVQYDHVLQDEYKQGFTAALLHGLFNWATVLVLLPLEVTISSSILHLGATAISWDKKLLT
jgi:hypothetical protein